VLCGILCLLLAVLAGLLLEGSSQMRSSLAWVGHSSQVLKTANRTIGQLQQAESGERGFALTRNADFGESVESAIAEAKRSVGDLVVLTSDNPAQNARAAQIRTLVNQRADALAEIARQARAGDFAGAQASVASGRGRNLMVLVDARIGDLLNEERSLSQSRMEAAEHRLNFIRWMVLAGMPLAIAAIAFTALALIRQIRRPVDEMMTVMGQLGSGDRSARILATIQHADHLAAGQQRLAVVMGLVFHPLVDDVGADDVGTRLDDEVALPPTQSPALVGREAGGRDLEPAPCRDRHQQGSANCCGHRAHRGFRAARAVRRRG
jgi:CHASE3 domain sensor protein